MGRNNSYDKPEYKEKLRLAKLEERNPNWKGKGDKGNFNLYRLLAKNNLEQKCSLCNSKNKLCVHHIDENNRNNKLNNIIIVCRGCHNKIHKTKRLSK